MRRREFITLVGGATAWPLAAREQQAAMPVIGLLHSGSAEPYRHLLTALRQGLGEAGYVEGRNFALEYAWADGRSERLPELAARLVRQQVALIIATAGSAAQAAKKAAGDIPIVFGVGNDPVAAGLVASLNRPGGNATGVYLFLTDLAPKRLGLLQELVPTARQIAVLINSSGSDAGLTNTTDINVREIEAAAATMNLRTEVFYANNVDQIDATFAAMAQKKVDALLVTSSPLYTSRRVQIVTLATRERLPVIFPSREFADVGGLMAYGTNLAQEYRKMGAVAGSILKGAKPADLPVQQSTTFEFVINLQTARALGFSVPAGLSARADEVIE